MKIIIVPNEKGNPPGKLADAELHFTEGPLDGLKLIGFGIWERRADSRLNVTFPARQYAVNGERRSFALLRPRADVGAQDRIRDLIVEAYRAYMETNDPADRGTYGNPLPKETIAACNRRLDFPERTETAYGEPTTTAPAFDLNF
jgi:hypothetical protein